MTVLNRLPCYPLTMLDGRLLEEVLQLVERQAGAAIPADDRDFTSYIANVLFDDWDQVWADAARAGRAAGPLCARIRRWLQPAWGLRLPPADRRCPRLSAFQAPIASRAKNFQASPPGACSRAGRRGTCWTPIKK